MRESPKRKRTHGKVREPSQWLRLMRAHGTFALITRMRLNHPPPYGRLKKRKRKSKGKQPSKPRTTLVEALAKVDAWSVELESGKSRADISRSEGLSRARVTQLMKLADLPPAFRQAPNTGESGVRDLTIKQAIALVAQGGAQ